MIVALSIPVPHHCFVYIKLPMVWVIQNQYKSVKKKRRKLILHEFIEYVPRYIIIKKLDESDKNLKIIRVQFYIKCSHPPLG